MILHLFMFTVAWSSCYVIFFGDIFYWPSIIEFAVAFLFYSVPLVNFSDATDAVDKDFRVCETDMSWTEEFSLILIVRKKWKIKAAFFIFFCDSVLKSAQN